MNPPRLSAGRFLYSSIDTSIEVYNAVRPLNASGFEEEPNHFDIQCKNPNDTP
jgi:hypothetical protein